MIERWRFTSQTRVSVCFAETFGLDHTRGLAWTGMDWDRGKGSERICLVVRVTTAWVSVRCDDFTSNLILAVALAV